MSVQEIEKLRNKHLALCRMYKNIADEKPYMTHSNFQLLEDYYSGAILRWTPGKYKFLQHWYQTDLLKSQKKDMASLELIADIKALSNKNEPMYAFITIGWNEQTVTPAKMLRVSQNVMALKYFKTVYMVLEKHRENGVHHHTHFLVTFEEKFPVSKILNWIYTTKGVKDICLGKNFIDYLGPQQKKPYQTYELYKDYVHGVKQEAKQQYITKDREWRKQNEINEIYNI